MSELMQKTENTNEVILTINDCLKKILSKNSEVEQCLAVQALGNLSLKNSTKILIEHLRNPDEDVRCDVGKALALLNNKDAIEPLIENLIQDPVGEAKVIYIEALQALKAISSVSILCVLVSTRGEEENVAWEEDGSGWDDWLSVQNAAIKALGSFGTQIDVEQPINAILKALDDPEGQDVWALSTRTLVHFGDKGILALLELLKNATPINRKRIVIALGDVNDDESANLLKAAMADPEPGVRIAAISSGAKRASEEICLLGLADGSVDVRVKTLNEYEFFDAKTLTLALDDDVAKVQIAACEAIIKDKKVRPALKLIKKAQKLLRNGSVELLSAMIGAMAVAKPNGAVEFIEDIVNHGATEQPVRLASLRALGELNSSQSVAMLSNAAGDENQEIRLAAIGSLGKIAKGTGALANKAIKILASAISGELVATPKDWKPEDDNVVDFGKHRNLKQEEQDQDSRMVKLDREGNIIDKSKLPKVEEIIEPEIIEVEEKQAPLSTLEAIMAANTEVPSQEEDLEIDESDIEFLELTNTGVNKRKKINPENKTPAHLDVRRLAALVGCETGKKELLEPLITAAADQDKQLCEAALDGFVALAQNDINISPAQRVLLRHATTGDMSLSYRAIRALAYIDVRVVTKVLVKLVGDANDVISAEAIKALKGRDVEIDLEDLCVNGQRQTRVAAAKLIACYSSEKAVPVLLNFALIEDGVHKKLAADFLKNHQHKAFEVVKSLLEEKQTRKRLIGLNILNYMMA